NAIRAAAQRGVDVKLIVADWEKGSTGVKGLQELSGLPNIHVAFSVIPEWNGGYIPFARVEHCKYIVADERTFWLGTSNCEKNYFYNTRNLGITGESSPIGKRLNAIFTKSWNSPYMEMITPEGSYQRREHGEKK
ncbi:MAG: phospholipase D-like domain-containing protein, partial [Bacteroidota bacterium]